MRVRHKSVELAFRHPFTISKGTKTHQPIFVVELEWKGLLGYGEAPAITYYGIDTQRMASDLEARRRMVESFALTDPERFWHFLHHLFPDNPFLVCALDMAAWDLLGKLRGKPLREMLFDDAGVMPVTDYTIGIDTEERMVEKMLLKPWPVYKIKVGTEGDMERLAALTGRTDSAFRVDANAGWSRTEAVEKLRICRSLGVELVEQPLAKDDWEGMRMLMESSPLPLFADESCVREEDVERCAGHFHGINIKLTKCGGITPARRMMKKARKIGLKTMLGCMNESSIGTAAIVHLAPHADYLDADGPLLLAEDLATGLRFEDARPSTSSTPGLGIDLINPF